MEHVRQDSSALRPWKAALVIMLLAVSTSFVIVVRRHQGGLGHSSDSGEGDDVLPGPTPPPASPSAAGIAERLRRSPARARLDPMTTATVAPSALPPPTVEDSGKKHLDDFAAATAAHHREPIDAAWSRKAVASLQPTLEQLAHTNAFTLIDIDCRKESCLATVEWDTYGSALASYGSVVSHYYSLPCAVEMILSMPTDPHEKYRSAALFSCHSNQDQ